MLLQQIHFYLYFYFGIGHIAWVSSSEWGKNATRNEHEDDSWINIYDLMDAQLFLNLHNEDDK